MIEDVPAEAINECRTKQPFWMSKWLWLTTIPPYIYFSGYIYFKVKMTGLGFPDAEINASVGETYLQAYEAFSIVTGGLLNSAIKNFLLVLNAILTYSLVGAIAILLLIFNRYYKPSWLVEWQLKFDRFTSHKKGNKPSIRKTFGMSAFSFVLFIFMSVSFYAAFNAIVILAFAGLSISAIIGIQHAEDTLSQPVCITLDEAKNEAKASYIIGCSKILMNDGKEIIGKVVYRDDSFLYVVTNTSAVSIPVTSVALNTREIHRN